MFIAPQVLTLEGVSPMGLGIFSAVIGVAAVIGTLVTNVLVKRVVYRVVLTSDFFLMTVFIVLIGILLKQNMWVQIGMFLAFFLFLISSMQQTYPMLL